MTELTADYGTDPHDPFGTRPLADTLLTEAGSATVRLRRDLAGPELPAGVRQAADEALGAVSTVSQVVRGTWTKLDRTATDDTLPEPARKRLTGEHHDEAGKQLDDLAARSDAALRLVEAGLLAATQPTFPAGEDPAQAREELRMLLDAAESSAETLRQLATGPDQRLAALAAGPYGRTILRAKGLPEDVINATTQYVAQATLAQEGVAPSRKAAAQALANHLPAAKQARMRALAAAHFALGWAGG